MTGVAVVVMGVLATSKRHFVQIMMAYLDGLLHLPNGYLTLFSLGGNTFHRDSREGLNRKA